MTVRSDSSSGQWKPYPEYKDSGVEWLGEIPVGWDVEKLKHISLVQFSNVDKHTIDGEIPVRLCNYVDVYYNDFITDELNLMTASATGSEIVKFSLKADDVIVTKDSESWEDIAVSAYVPFDIEGALCGYHLAQIHPSQKHLCGKFLFRSISSVGINDQFRIEATGITRFGLSKYCIENSLFPVPPLPEQKEIASFLDERTARIDTIIEKKERQIELLKEKRSALISHAVTKGLDPDAEMKDSGVEWLGEIPVGWDVVQLKSIFKIVNGSTPKSSVPEYWDGDILWITPDDLGSINKPELTDSNRRITKEGYRSCGTSLVSKGSLVLSTRAPIGYLAIAGKQLCSNQGCRCLLFRSNDSEKYYYYLMFSSRPELESLGQGSTFKELSRDKLSSVKLVSPPLPEQKAIAAFLDRETERIDGLVGKVEASVSMLKEYRAALISAAVTGKIDVRGV